MIKKLVLLTFLFLFTGTPLLSALEFAGQTIDPAQIESMPPNIQNQLKKKLNDQKEGAGKIQPVLSEPELPVYRGEANREVGKDNVSVIEKQYRELYQSDLSKNLKQFGYNIFKIGVTRPTGLAVPDGNYIIGTGDELFIRVWGSGLDAAYPAIVDRSGNINLPKLGILNVAGTRYQDIEHVIQNEANNYVQGINVNVTFTKLRSLEIYIVGAVKKPGLHIVPAFSTIFDGLMAAGGVHKRGSLRQIKLNRGGKLVQKFDLYDLLIKGTRSSDRQLKNKDVIFVPGIGNTVAIAGAVNNETIFEITESNTIKDIVTLAGGLLPQAFGTRIYLRRFNNNQEFTVKDIESKKSFDKWNKITVQNGDLIDVTFFDSLPNIVSLEGHVGNRDIFQYRNGLKLSDVLTSTAQLKPDAVLDFALLHRYNPETTRFTPMQFPLEQVFSKAYDAFLHPFDKIQILSREDAGIKEGITINGAVWKPGQYEYQSGLTLDDVIAIAGGTKFGARTRGIELSRQKISNNAVETEYTKLNLETDGNFRLAPFDTILVPMLKDAAHIKTVEITGEVAFPGTYTISEGNKLSDVIKRAGGFTKHAYFFGAKYTSEGAKKIQQRSINQMIEQLQLEYIQVASETSQEAISEEDAKAAEIARKQVELFLNKLKQVKSEGRIAIYLADLDTFSNSSYDFILKEGDALHIPEKPSFVSIVGSVYTPGSFLYQPNRTVEFYLNKSGGLAKNADKDHVYLLKANGEIASKSQSSSFGSTFEGTVLMPGDTIVVPQDLDKIPYLKYFQSISDVIFKVATTVGIVFAI